MNPVPIYRFSCSESTLWHEIPAFFNLITSGFSLGLRDVFFQHSCQMCIFIPPYPNAYMRMDAKNVQLVSGFLHP